MNTVEQLKVDADYLARCLERFRATGHVRIPVASADVMLRNYAAAIQALSPADGSTIDHPQAVPSHPFTETQAKAQADMDAATAATLDLLKKKPQAEAE